MYTLTLTQAERQAIDWVGHRYAHGNNLFDILMECDSPSNREDDWDSQWDITYEISEPLAWRIRDIAEEGNYLWDCFSPELAHKLTIFCIGIV